VSTPTGAGSSGAGPGGPPVSDDLTEAVLTASRVLVAVAARSLAVTEEQVTLPQYRVLVVIASRGPQRLGDLAEVLAINPSSATRVCDRLVAKQLVKRQRAASDRREIRLILSPAGRALVDEVTRQRRDDIAALLAAIADGDRAPLVAGLRALATAAGEVPDPDWALGF
jgi:DNA-binding MarR family transcriptional regulator